MTNSVSILGFGEAGSTFALAGAWKARARAFDLREVDYGFAEVVGCATFADAVSGARVILSLVTADAAIDAATTAAEFIEKGAVFIDMNSVAPDTKQRASSMIEEAGGLYVDAAIMAPVNPARMAVPILLSGPHAALAVEALQELGYANVRCVGTEIGRASMIKMLRSIIFKGAEALTAECVIACQRADVLNEVMSSLGGDWAEQMNYRLDRMLIHGARRAAEMKEVAKTLQGLGVDASMTRGTLAWQDKLGHSDGSPIPDSLNEKLERLGAWH